MYEPGRLLPHADAFVRWLRENHIPHVFLSNTGAKNSSAVQTKFATPPYALSGEAVVDLAHIHTAAEAQVDYMLDHVPHHAKVLVLSGGQGQWRHDLQTRGGERGAARVATWEVRTELSEREAKRWAACAACTRNSEKLVYVAFFHDGGLGEASPAGAADGAVSVDAVSGRPGFADWGFEIIKVAGFLLSHGAQFVYTADDAYNPSVDTEYPGLVWPLPGPGMFATMMKALMYPHNRHAVACPGKGGKAGGVYMMEKAREMLMAQGHTGERSQIMMVGDRYGPTQPNTRDRAHITSQRTPSPHPAYAVSAPSMQAC